MFFLVYGFWKLKSGKVALLVEVHIWRSDGEKSRADLCHANLRGHYDMITISINCTRDQPVVMTISLMW